MFYRNLHKTVHTIKQNQIKSTHKLLTHKSQFAMSSISQWMRKFMNRIKFQDNRAIQAREDKITIEVHQTPKEVEEKFIGDEKFKSLVEKERMQKIDQIIGTRTYFHETKTYQERIDSDHVQVIQELAKKNPEPKREDLNWQNPQAPEQYKVKSSRKFYKNIKNLREYPKHNYRIVDFSDQKSQQNIQFLGKQSLYSKLSLKWVDTYQKSIQNQTIQDISYQLQSYRYSPSHVYFSTSHEPSKLFRIKQDKFTPELTKSVTKFTQLQQNIEQVISMEQIYELLKEYFHDERVNQWLKKVQNGQIGYMLSGYQISRQEDRLVVWVDLLGTRKEYVHLYKNLAKRKKSQSDETNASLNRQEKPQHAQQQNSQQTHITHPQPSSPPTIHHQPTLIFNCQPATAFSSHSQSFYLIQRSQQGTFVELVSVPILENDSLGQPEVIYKCKPYEEMEIVNDEGMGYTFVKIREVGKRFSERVVILEEKGDEKVVDVIELELEEDNSKELDEKKQTKKSPQSRITVNSCPQGLIITEFHSSNNQFFKYGSSKEYAKQVHLIPYKSHLQLSQSSSTRTQKQYHLAGSSKTEKNRPSARELDVNKKQLIYQCPTQQFITQISVRQSHLILSLSTTSIYSKKRLLFIPYQQSKNPHSLIFPTQSLSFVNFGYSYSSQLVNFFINRSIVFNEYYQYTIWKKELKQLTDDDVYIERVKVTGNVQLTVTLLNRYLDHLPKFFLDRNKENITHEGQQYQTNTYQMENSQVPVLIYFIDSKSATDSSVTSQSPHKSSVHLKKFLQKGTLLITISCRGTLSSDLVTFYNGSGENFSDMLQDLQHAIQWTGNNLGSNISLYAKGPISGLAGMMLNVRYPFLLTSTVLHDAVFELMDRNLFYQHLDYFVRYQNVQRGAEQFEKFWKYFNPATFLFKRSQMMTKQMIQEEKQQKEEQLRKQIENQQPSAQDSQTKSTETKSVIEVKPPSIGTLENIVISCSTSEFAKNQARRMIYHLRQNTNLKYEEVFLKEFLEGEDEELFNLAFIWGKMKERLEHQHRK